MEGLRLLRQLQDDIKDGGRGDRTKGWDAKKNSVLEENHKSGCFREGRKLLTPVTTPSLLPLSSLFSSSQPIFRRLQHNASASGDSSNTLL